MTVAPASRLTRASCWMVSCACNRHSALGQYGARDQAYRQGGAQGCEDEIIEIAQDGYEVWNQVNRAERIGDEPGHRKLCIPRRPGVACRKVKCKGFRLETTGGLLQLLKQIFGRSSGCRAARCWEPSIRSWPHLVSPGGRRRGPLMADTCPQVRRGRWAALDQLTDGRRATASRQQPPHCGHLSSAASLSGSARWALL
jgi:hypothetical protein